MMRKGQAAMEFLMTYGWAILAAVIVIGVLAYFGVFSPATYVPTTCVLSAPLGCDKNQVSASTTGVSLVMRNGGIDNLDVKNVTISGCGSYNTPFTLVRDTSQTVTVPCTLTLGEKFRGNVDVKFVVSGGTLEQVSAGQVVAKVV